MKNKVDPSLLSAGLPSAGRTAAAGASPGPLDAVGAARAAQSGRAAGAPRGGRGRHGRGKPGADGGQARRPGAADPGQRPGPRPDHHRPRAAAAPGSPGRHRPRRPPGRPRGGPARAAWPPATPCCRRAGPAAAPRPPAPSSSGSTSSSCRWPPATRPACPRSTAPAPDTAAALRIAAGDHPGRLRSEAARAHLRATPPRLPRGR
jgi:translation initiation factor IF-2